MIAKLGTPAGAGGLARWSFMWGNLITAMVGMLGLAGVIYTQRRADAREIERWERERDVERKRWDREDAARSYDHRRQAYVDFLAELLRLEDQLVDRIDASSATGNFPEPPEDWLDGLHNLSTSVRIFGTLAAWGAANDSIEALDNVSTSLSWEYFGSRIEPYITQIRRDLMVGDD